MTETATPRRVDDARALGSTGQRPRLVIKPAVILGVIAVVPVAALAAFLISLTLNPVYGAQTDIIFDPGSGLSDAAANRVLATQEVVLRSDAVLGPVSSVAQIPTRSIDKSLNIEVVGQSNVIRFTVAHQDPDTARLLAETITDEYEEQISAALPESVRWSVLTPPHLLNEPLRPRPVLSAALGALVGIFIAAAAVVVLVWPRLARNDVVGISDL